MLKSGTRMNNESKKDGHRFRSPPVTASGGYIPVHPCSSPFLFIGGLTMKQGKNIVKQARSKNVLFRPVPSALALSDRARENDSGNQTVNLPNALTLSRIFVVPLLV